jgi:hypothetical protein
LSLPSPSPPLPLVPPSLLSHMLARRRPTGTQLWIDSTRRMIPSLFLSSIIPPSRKEALSPSLDVACASARARVCLRLRACVRACACACVGGGVYVRAYTGACASVREHVCARVNGFALCMSVSARLFVECACVRAHTCVFGCACASVSTCACGCASRARARVRVRVRACTC